jgi:hypothetical protein
MWTNCRTDGQPDRSALWGSDPVADPVTEPVADKPRAYPVTVHPRALSDAHPDANTSPKQVADNFSRWQANPVLPWDRGPWSM